MLIGVLPVQGDDPGIVPPTASTLVVRARLLVVGAPLAALGRWLPRVVSVAKLALGQLIVAGLLLPEHLELAVALRALVVGPVGLERLVLLGRPRTTEEATQE
jgi:hypothetical protein